MIVVARGGGSLEDLMAFNSEIVCRAVAASATPVVSAVGHERDVTLCDEVADVRVATPTAAAAVVVPSAEALEGRICATPTWRCAAGSCGRAPTPRRPSRGGPPRWRRRCGRPEAIGRDRVERLEPRMRRRPRAGGGAGARSGWTSRRGRSRAPPGPAASAPRPAWPGRRGSSALLSPRRTVARGYAIVRDAGGGARDRVGGGASAPGQGLSIELRDGRVAATATEVSR